MITLATLIQPALALDVNNPEPPTTLEKMTTTTKGAIGVVFGLTVGTPIRIIKNMHSESQRAISSLKKDFSNEPGAVATTMATVIGIPYGVARGAVIGVVKGVPEGVKKGYEWPFTYDSIGIDE